MRCFTRTLRVTSASELESWIGFDHWLIPPELPLVHEPGKQERRHALGVGGRHEECVRVHKLRLAQLAHTKAAFEDYTTAVEERERSAGNVQLLHRGFDKAFQLRDALGSEGSAFRPAKVSLL